MEFSRTLSGLAAKYLFYNEILVFVEGYTDIPFYDTVLHDYNCRILTYREEKNFDKFVEEIVKEDLPYIVIFDGHYEILTRKRSVHRRLILLHRHSVENYLIEEEPIEQFRHNRAPLKDSLEKLQSSFSEILKDTERKFMELLVLDVANQRAKTGYKVFPEGADQFFAGPKTSDFQDSKIQERCNEATQCVNQQDIEEARALVEGFLKGHRFIDLLPGHFAFSVIRRWINYTVNVRQRILEEDIRVYLATEVWRLVKTRDHNSLKRRLRSAVREAERIRQV